MSYYQAPHAHRAFSNVWSTRILRRHFSAISKIFRLVWSNVDSFSLSLVNSPYKPHPRLRYNYGT
ncbi:unnamed protein product [Clonostachys rosea f. rosea IK726]|uniref:Uncharacterized protein n=1 Tax=Clonostachys rosea f. rosea IK726 TaxID=1349383 RepID=A0ACA9TYQ7_BIOOC|nr:unnamed protein product [Clonostachys rosea f. rosea IK726]